jgi:HSP20 family molecular chaperone IbpA
MADKYDNMSMEERAEFDKQAKQKEEEEQASTSWINANRMSHELITVVIPSALPYKWNQDLTSVSVTAPLPAGTRAKNLNVEIKKTKLKVKCHLLCSST